MSQSMHPRPASAPLGLRAILQSDHGGAAVSFILVLPIFLFIIGVLVQYALIVNAKVMIDYAAQQAARAAVTSLPEGTPQHVMSAAYMALTPISPQAAGDPAAEAQSMADALTQVGAPVMSGFANRYTYAMAATTVSWQPQIDYTIHEGQAMTLTLVYRLRLTVPAAQMVVGASDTVAGLGGRFLNISSTCQVQTSHSRASGSDGNGWPN